MPFVDEGQMGCFKFDVKMHPECCRNSDRRTEAHGNLYSRADISITFWATAKIYKLFAPSLRYARAVPLLNRKQIARSSVPQTWSTLEGHDLQLSIYILARSGKNNATLQTWHGFSAGLTALPRRDGRPWDQRVER